MKIDRCKLRFLPAAALLFFAVSAAAQPGQNSGQSIEGAWQVTITLPDGKPCGPAGALATRDGLVLAESCFGKTAGPGYGVWARTANGRFAITFTGVGYGPDGAVAGTYKVRAAVGLAADGNSFSGSYITDMFDVAGNRVGNLLGTLKGIRMPLELLN
jgi:hypothetical protein